MLAQTTMDGSLAATITDAQRLVDTAAAAAPSAALPTGEGFLAEILQTAKEQAEAEKRKATYLLVGVGAGALLVGLMIGRYVFPKRKR